MAKNQSGTFVHVHGEGGQTTVVEPGQDFPDGFEATSDLTDEPSDEQVVAAGPGQFPGTKANSAEPKQWGDYKVPELRSHLDAAGVSYDADDRKDALVEKAEAAGLDPNAARES